MTTDDSNATTASGAHDWLEMPMIFSSEVAIGRRAGVSSEFALVESDSIAAVVWLR